MTLWVDVTTIASCPPPATGIPRVELELAERLFDLHPGTRYCLYEAPLGRFSALEVDGFRALVRFHRSNGGAPELEIHRRDRSAVGGHGIFDAGDTLLSCGFNWRPALGNMAHVHALQDAIGLRLIAMCHDLVPIRFTHFVPGMEAVYAPYLAKLACRADHVLCNSRCTQRDLLGWIDGCVGSPSPTSVVPMGCEARVSAAGTIGERVRRVLDVPFLLSVGTIERRKSHETLTRAYTRLVDGGATELPLLVLAGRIGEGGQALLDEVTADQRIRGRVAFLTEVGDVELDALYGACLFTLFPSLYEGWGLPVCESLVHRKFCVASDRGAVPEAGQGLVDHVDPWNVEAWAAAIARYLGDPDALSRRERDIETRYRPTSWRASAEHVLAIAASWR